MMRRSWILPLFVLLSAGCGDDDGTGGGGGSSATTTSVSAATTSSGTTSSTATSTMTTGTGGGSDLDESECDGNEDCPGGACIDINGGYKACQYPVIEATMCTGSMLDQCCDSSECMNGQACYEAPILPYCGGPQPEIYNACAIDQCASNDDCPAGVCVPAGVVVGNKVAMCVMAQCFGTTCGQESLSSCALVREPCCGGPAGFLCIDETTGCQTNDDCPGGHCQLGVCMQGPPQCPA
jgi:hypothetical protein